MSTDKALRTEGVYILIIFLSDRTTLDIGKMCSCTFAKGYYSYTGSALAKSGLNRRISRHLQKGKRKHWHIDYLLAHKRANVVAVISMPTSQRWECRLNRAIKESLNGQIILKGFGSSDCHQGCESHLLYFGNRDVTLNIMRICTMRFGHTPQISIRTQDKA